MFNGPKKERKQKKEKDVYCMLHGKGYLYDNRS